MFAEHFFQILLVNPYFFKGKKKALLTLVTNIYSIVEFYTFLVLKILSIYIALKYFDLKYTNFTYTEVTTTCTYTAFTRSKIQYNTVMTARTVDV